MRTDRIKCFEEIISSVRDYFLQKANTLESSEYLQHYFGIKANPDIENEKNPTRLEVFWDDRLIDINPVDKDIVEKGAKISIRCSVRGFVTIQLFPCSTDSQKCREDSILLLQKLNPWWLGKSFFKNILWRVFIAYSTVTAIDGNPSFLSRCFVCIMRYFCTKNVRGIIEGTKFWYDLKLFIGVVFAIVSSSLFVYFLPSTSDEKIDKIEDSITRQTVQIDSLAKELRQDKVISTKLDSILLYQKQIEKNTKYKGGKK